MNRLTKLADKFGTDKGTAESAHMFTEFYQPFFEKYESPKILEFGTWQGGSTRMFNAFYDGDCEIWTCDILDESAEKVKDLNNVHFIHTDVSDKEALAKLFEQLKGIEFDIIIDDASHKWPDQMFVLSAFHPLLKKDGIYILEDIHYSRLYEDMEYSPLFFVNFLTPNIMLTEEENNELISKIKDVQIFSRKNNSEEMTKYFGGRSMTALLTFEK